MMRRRRKPSPVEEVTHFSLKHKDKEEFKDDPFKESTGPRTRRYNRKGIQKDESSVTDSEASGPDAKDDVPAGASNHVAGVVSCSQLQGGVQATWDALLPAPPLGCEGPWLAGP
ncbi:Uncharacterized protein DAT39_020444 [Clarias magur]|uniref:Uncharacterized protein n=1 Tax=Clarias magur TaxID=1594786 RepID=A0A8J4TYU8_CLAMG|nr:Uncharacterized protein DAT39_020444 [Clarias magur]